MSAWWEPGVWAVAPVRASQERLKFSRLDWRITNELTYEIELTTWHVKPRAGCAARGSCCLFRERGLMKGEAHSNSCKCFFIWKLRWRFYEGENDRRLAVFRLDFYAKK